MTAGNRKENIGIVYLIGAGPGDPGLITVKGKEALQNCDAVVYDNLIPDELIVLVPERVEKYYVGKSEGRHTLEQEDINALLVKLAKEGKRIARLKGGDPFIFGKRREVRDNPGNHSGSSGAGLLWNPLYRQEPVVVCIIPDRAQGDR
jgi:siroheme synthase